MVRGLVAAHGRILDGGRARAGRRRWRHGRRRGVRRCRGCGVLGSGVEPASRLGGPVAGCRKIRKRRKFSRRSHPSVAGRRSSERRAGRQVRRSLARVRTERDQASGHAGQAEADGVRVGLVGAGARDRERHDPGGLPGRGRGPGRQGRGPVRAVRGVQAAPAVFPLGLGRRRSRARRPAAPAGWAGQDRLPPWSACPPGSGPAPRGRGDPGLLGHAAHAGPAGRQPSLRPPRPYPAGRCGDASFDLPIRHTRGKFTGAWLITATCQRKPDHSATLPHYRDSQQR